MGAKDGRIGFEVVKWFNGGLFDDDAALPLVAQDIALLRQAAGLDWGDIDPSVSGTLFERGLDPENPAARATSERRLSGIHYTDRETIMKIIEPVAARDRWLDPPELVETAPPPVPGMPGRLVPRDAKAAAVLKGRTLTRLYNARGTPEGRWLDDLHADLDAAVAAAYGWPADIAEEAALAALLAFNRARAA